MDNPILYAASVLCSFALGCLTGAWLMKNALLRYVNKMTKIEPNVRPR